MNCGEQSSGNTPSVRPAVCHLPQRGRLKAPSGRELDFAKQKTEGVIDGSRYRNPINFGGKNLLISRKSTPDHNSAFVSAANIAFCIQMK